jgi:hypothetical protein
MREVENNCRDMETFSLSGDLKNGNMIDLNKLKPIT